MIPNGLFTQVGMIILSLGIFFTYVQPTFQDISGVQDDIAVYQTKIGNVAEVNKKLDSLVERLESASAEDRSRLLTYMPDAVDEIAVPRDLFLIANQAGVLYVKSSYLSEFSETVSPDDELREDLPQPHQVDLAVEGTYSQIKNLVSLLEQNNYPLEIYNLDIDRLEGGFLGANFTIRTYSYKSPLVDREIEF